MSTATATTTVCVRSSTNERVAAAAGWTLLGCFGQSGQLTLSVVQRHVRDLHVAVVAADVAAADGPCYAAAFSGSTVVEIPSSMNSETVNHHIGGNGARIRPTIWFRFERQVK